MKTIALKEKTFEMLKQKKKLECVKSFDELIIKLVQEKDKVPKSLFGSLKGKISPLTQKERKEMWEDEWRK